MQPLASRQRLSHSEAKPTAQRCCLAARSEQCVAEHCWRCLHSRDCRLAPASSAETTSRCYDHEICPWSSSSCLTPAEAWLRHWHACRSLWGILEARPRTESGHIQHTLSEDNAQQCMLYSLFFFSEINILLFWYYAPNRSKISFCSVLDVLTEQLSFIDHHDRNDH